MVVDTLGFRPVLRADPITTKYNTRKKYFVDSEGEYHLLQTITADRQIFNPLHLEAVEETNKCSYENADDDMRFEEARIIAEVENMSQAYADILDHRIMQNWERSCRRARNKVFDYAVAEYDFAFFVTLTLSGKDFPRSDVKTAIQKLNVYLRNRVQRNGLKYVIVPEYHHDGKSIHFHGLFNDALPMVDSGTVIRPTGGKPVKLSTAQRQGYKREDCKTVYNIPSWNFGFTTAIPVYGKREACAAYVAKYITKNVNAVGDDFRKIGGRFYYSSNNLRAPLFEYQNTDYDTAFGEEYNAPSCTMKIQYPE